MNPHERLKKADSTEENIAFVAPIVLLTGGPIPFVGDYQIHSVESTIPTIEPKRIWLGGLS